MGVEGCTAVSQGGRTLAGRIPEEVIEEIKLTSDIVALISDYLPLKRTGKSYKGLCPFHNERTPSFNVNPDDQFFYCFGCGAGGNIFTFVMKMEHVGFVEAVELVARRFGIRIPETESSTAEQKARRARDALLEVNKEALAFFVKCLWSSPRAVAYLRRRGISEDGPEVPIRLCAWRGSLGETTARSRLGSSVGRAAWPGQDWPGESPLRLLSRPVDVPHRG